MLSKNHSSHLLISFVIVLLALGSCKNSGVDLKKSQEIVSSLKNSPKGLNPVINLSGDENQINGILHFPLADYNPVSLQFEPILIKDIPTAEMVKEGPFTGKLKYDMEIIPEATWDNGMPITGRDYAFTIKSILHPLSNAIRFRAYLNNISEVVVDSQNPKKFTVYLDQRNIADVELVSGIPILPEYHYNPSSSLQSASISQLKDEKLYAELEAKDSSILNFAEAFNSTKYSRDSVVGCGRYRLKEWLSDQYIKVERKENHFFEGSTKAMEIAIPQEIIFLLAPDQATSLAQLKSGNLDIYDRIDYQQMADLKSDENYSQQFEFESVSIPRAYYLSINTRKPELQDKEVRQALGYLMDVDTLISSYENGFGKRINSPFLSITDKSEVTPRKYNLKKAILLLDEAGWKDSNGNQIRDKLINGKLVELDIQFMSTSSQLGQLVANIFKQLCKPAGVNIDIQTVDQTTLRKQLNNLDFEMTTAAASQSLAPYDPYALLHTDNADPGESNVFNFGNSKSDSLIELIRSTTDVKERDQAYIDLEKILAEEMPIIFLYSPVVHIVHKKEVNGIITIKKPGFVIQSFERR